MPINLSKPDGDNARRVTKTRSTRGPVSNRELADRIFDIAQNVEAIVHKIWGNGDVGILTHLEVMRNQMVTKEHMDEKLDTCFEDWKSSVMSQVKTEIALAVLDHEHEAMGDTKPKQSLVDLAKEAGIDLPALLQGKKEEEKKTKSTVYNWMVQINEFLRAWPVVYLIVLLVLIALGKPLSEIAEFFKAMQTP